MTSSNIALPLAQYTALQVDLRAALGKKNFGRIDSTAYEEFFSYDDSDQPVQSAIFYGHSFHIELTGGDILNVNIDFTRDE
jgi:hypothetical protein